MKKIFLTFLYLTVSIFLFILIIFLIIYISVIVFRYNSNYDPCHFEKVFSSKTFSSEFLFSSFGRDETRFCSFSLSETENNLKDFKKIDEKYFKNDKIKFAFENLDYFIKDEAKEYTDEEKNILKNIKNTLKNREKDKEILYKYFKIYENLEDFEICYYKKSENKGYCIIQHM